MEWEMCVKENIGLENIINHKIIFETVAIQNYYKKHEEWDHFEVEWCLNG